MLQLILGSAGSGKTTAVRQAICDRMEAGANCMIFVPEQSSFETERQFLRLLGPQKAQQVQVTSFRRLTDAVYRRYGRPAGTVLSEGGRNLLMALALEETAEQLTFYREYRKGTELIALLLSVEKELKCCGITPEDLLELAQTTTDSVLQTKLRDIGLLLSAYDALLAQTYLDPLDDLTRILPLLEEHRFFAQWELWIDGFKDFTKQELQIIARMLGQSPQVTVALCTDQAYAAAPHSLFAPVCKTIGELKQLARIQQVSVAIPIQLREHPRFRSEELSFLEQQLFRRTQETWAAPVEKLRAFCGESRKEEVLFAAGEIRRLVMEEGYRYRDFAVLARTVAPYQGLLETAFSHHQIPCFLDDPRPVLMEPIPQTILSAFRILETNYETEAIFSYLKTGMLNGISAEEIALLENYTYLWSMTGAIWKREWTAHPRGFAGAMTEEDTQLLDHLNQLRLQIVMPLEQLRQAAMEQTGLEISEAVYAFLLQIGADQCLLALSDQLRRLGQFDRAERQERLWELCMDSLDQMASLLRETVLSPERYASLFRLLLSAAEIAGIPEGLDQVTVGEIGRIRLSEPKVVFVLGMVQDEFPAAISDTGAFCDRERREMIELGLPLSATMDDLEDGENYLAYTALCSSRERLYLCYFSMELSGTERLPSPVLREITRIFPDIPLQRGLERDTIAEALSRKTAFTLLARLRRRNSRLTATLQALFAEEPDYADALASLDRITAGELRRLEDPERAALLFPSQMVLSASQVERFYDCRFRYFCQYGLRLQERRPASVSAMEYGTLMHDLLEHLFRQHGHEALHRMTDGELRQEVVTEIERYLEEQLGGRAEKSPRFLYLFEKLTESAMLILRWIAEELCQSQFVPLGYEMKIGGTGADFPAWTIPTEMGSATMVGAVDRVDVYERNGEKIVRVIDYKTGQRGQESFRLYDILYGMNLQMLIYLAALLETDQFRPGGVLYLPAVRPNPTVQWQDSPEARTKATQKAMQMKGLLLDDPEVLLAMDATGNGTYINTKLTKSGTLQYGTVVNEAQMRLLLGHVKHLVQEMAEQLHQGQIEEVPLQGETHDGCSFCRYRPICGHEADGARRDLQKKSDAEVLAYLKGKEEEAHGAQVDS